MMIQISCPLGYTDFFEMLWQAKVSRYEATRCFEMLYKSRETPTLWQRHLARRTASQPIQPPPVDNDEPQSRISNAALRRLA